VDYDRDVKMPMYAQAGVRELWLIDVLNGKLEVYRQPTPQGAYASTQVLTRGDKLAIEALPGVEFGVGDMMS
jgi:Uma2 family endonuclease